MRRRRKVSRNQISETRVRRIIRDQIKAEEFNRIFLNEAIFGGLGLTALATFILKKVAQSPATRDIVLEWAADPQNTKKLERFYAEHPVLGLGVKWIIKHLTVKQIEDQLKKGKAPTAKVKTSPEEANKEAEHITGLWKKIPQRLQQDIDSVEEDLEDAEPQIQVVPEFQDSPDDATSFFSKPPPMQKSRRRGPRTELPAVFPGEDGDPEVDISGDITDVIVKDTPRQKRWIAMGKKAVEKGLFKSVEEFFKSMNEELPPSLKNRNMRESAYSREVRDLIKLIRR